MNYRYILFLVIGGLLFYSCEPEFEDYNYTSGSANFATYVSIGNSLTSGYADGSLYRESQENSFPLMLSQQFQKVGGGDFVQPLMNGEMGILPGKLVLGYATDCLGTTSLAPVPAEGDTEPIEHVGMAVNNLGVPGAKSFHLLAEGYGNPAGLPTGMANPYYVRFASSPAASVIGDAIALNPTFFTLFIGNNDVLGYATSGGLGDSITSQETFGFALNTILMSVTATGAKGAIANVPDISSIPFFNTVPINGYVLDEEQAALLNQYLGPLGFEYQAGPNYFIIEDASTQLGFRQMVEGELLLLTVPQDSLKCAYWGGFDPVAQLPVPIPAQYVLTNEEIGGIQTAITGYNHTIKSLSETYDLAHVDLNQYLKGAENGIIYNGESFSTTFITGNAFSLDGVHLTPKGYAIIANQFIQAINAKYGSTVPEVFTTNYRANVLP